MTAEEPEAGFLGNSAPWWPEMEQPTTRDNPAGIGGWGSAPLGRGPGHPENDSDLNLERMRPSETNALHRMVHYTPAAISTLLSPWWVGTGGSSLGPPIALAQNHRLLGPFLPETQGSIICLG